MAPGKRRDVVDPRRRDLRGCWSTKYSSSPGGGVIRARRGAAKRLKFCLERRCSGVVCRRRRGCRGGWSITSSGHGSGVSRGHRNRSWGYWRFRSSKPRSGINRRRRDRERRSYRLNCACCWHLVNQSNCATSAYGTGPCVAWPFSLFVPGICLTLKLAQAVAGQI
jgi:hypothetical protein